MPQFAVDDYHVGWICALPKELAASKAMLDGPEHPKIAVEDPLDTNSYVLGSIHGHNVVMACLPAADDGTNAAAVVATNLMRTFKAVRFGLMVGIGGGIPDLEKDHDIRLGDIVVSQPSGTNGGVIQHDKLKVLEDGKTERKGFLNRPPTTLLTALQNIQSQHEMEDSLVPEYLEAMIKRYPKMKKIGYGFPEREVDALHCSKCHKTQSSCDLCEKGIMKRDDREEKTPEIHYGLIASGNQVVKSAEDRDRLRAEYGALCVEMEAAGLMNSFPCLIVRGICDYADSYKNDNWHRYAAATAAAYAKELLSHVSAEQARLEKPIQQVVDLLTKHVEETREYFHQQQEHNQRQETKYQSDKENECLRALKTSVYTDHKNINPDPVPGTCRWVLGGSAFEKWRDSPKNDLLWISADPGCGKSVLAKHVVDHCLHKKDDESTTASSIKLPHTICYFFFKDNEIQDNLATALSAILHQLFTQQPQLIQHALPSWESNGNRLQRDSGELWKILKDSARDPDAKSITCVFDALDECREADRKRLIDFVCAFYNEEAEDHPAGSCFKFLLTSRPYYAIQNSFDQKLSSLPSVQIRGEDKNQDIREEIDLVVKAKVATLARELSLTNNTKERIETRLLCMENRTYLWLHLAIEDIEKTLHDSLRPNQETFTALPSSVDEAYEKLLNRGVRNKKTVKQILTIVVGARRPLTISELSIALDVATNPEPIQAMADLTIEPEHLERNIRDWCGLFIFFNHKKVYLMHQTAKEFLLSTGASNPGSGAWKYCLRSGDVEHDMARISVSFLCISEFDRDSTVLEKELSKDRESSPNRLSVPTEARSFFSFAAKSWAQHVRSAALIDSDTESKVYSLYNTSRKAYSYLLRTGFEAPEGDEWVRYMDEVEFAAFNGHINFLRHFLEKSPGKINPAKNKDGGLLWACMRGHTDVVQMLLERGAKMTNATYFTDNALMLAAARGYDGVVRLLLQAGANVDNDGEWNALQKAAIHGHTQVAKTLVDAGAEVDTQEGETGDALYLAAAFGNEKIVQLLVDAKADVNAKGGFIGTPLAAASWHGHEEIVRLLLKAGADVNIVCGESGTALQAASSMGNVPIVQLLLESGANIDALGGSAGTALQAAVIEEYDDVVEVLIKAKADVNIVGGEHGTAWKAALAGGDEDIIRMLRDAGARE